MRPGWVLRLVIILVWVAYMATPYLVDFSSRNGLLWYLGPMILAMIVASVLWITHGALGDKKK